MTTKTLLFGVAVIVVGCAETQYVYTPQTANEVTANLPAARTPIPQERPEGAIEVASYGITQLHPQGTTVPALHVRMIATNDGDDIPWQLDTREQYVEIAGEGRSVAMYVNSDVQTLPIVSIGRHERRVFDFYFPLPETIRDEHHLPRFDVQWQVTTPARVVASRTTFDRVTQEPTSYYAYGDAWPYWAGYGPYWWYDPFYPSVAFVHARPFHFHGHGGEHVMVDHFHGHFAPGGAHVAHGGRH